MNISDQNAHVLPVSGTSGELRRWADDPNLAGALTRNQVRDAFALLADCLDALAEHKCAKFTGSYKLPVKVYGASVFQPGDPQPLTEADCPNCALLSRAAALTAQEQGQ